MFCLCCAAHVSIMLLAAKSDQLGATTTRMLPRSRHIKRCPVVAAYYLKQSALAVGCASGGRSPPMSSIGTSGSGITGSDLSKVVKKVATALGRPQNEYSSHSCRSGGATELVRAGVDTIVIQLFGRWMSKAFKRYTHLSPQVGLSIMRKLDEASILDTDLAML